MLLDIAFNVFCRKMYSIHSDAILSNLDLLLQKLKISNRNLLYLLIYVTLSRAWLCVCYDKYMTMKRNNTLNGQCIWIHGCIENLGKKMIPLYLGCDTCGSKTYNDIGTNHKCSKSSCTPRTKIYATQMNFLGERLSYLEVTSDKYY